MWSAPLFAHKNNFVAGIDYVQQNQSARKYTALNAAGHTYTYTVNIYNPNYANFGVPTRFGNEADSVFDQKTIGLYSQDQLNLTDDLILATGLRYNISTQTNTGFQSSTDYALNPNAGLIYKILPTVSAYVNYAQGFNPQQPASLTTTPSGYIPPQRSEQTEFGFKWIDKKYGSFNAALFELLLDNVATTNPSIPTQNIYVGQARNMGVELDASFKFTDKISLLANFANISSKVTKDTSYVGNSLASVPNMTYGSWVMYDEGTYGGGVGFNHVSSRAGDIANDFKLSAYGTLDAAAHYDLTKNIRLQVNLKNITNEQYFSGGGSRVNIMQGQPFTVMSVLDIKFPI